MTAYRYDEQTAHYAGTQQCQLDPMASKREGKDVWLLPANCTLIAPPEAKEGYYIVWKGTEWAYEEIPVDPEPEPHVPTTEEKLAQLDAQYQADRAELKGYYLDFILEEDTESAEEIKSELTALYEEYQIEYNKIKEED